MFSGKEVGDLLATCGLVPDVLDIHRMVPIAGFYLGVTPPSVYHTQRPQSMSQASLPSANGTNAHKTAANRASMPVVPRITAGSPPAIAKKVFEPTPEEESDEETKAERAVPKKSIPGTETRHKSNGTMDRNFRFPPASQSPPVPPVPQQPSATSPPSPPPVTSDVTARSVAVAPDIEHGTAVQIITPSSVEVPPPPPVEKENRRVIEEDDAEEEVGDTVEIDLR